MHDLLAFYLIFAGLGLTMAAVLYEPVFQIIATWFERKRGRALLLLTLIGAFASVVYVPLAGWLVEQHGWRTTLLVLAALLLTLTLPVHLLVLRRSPADLGLYPDGRVVEPTLEASRPELDGFSLSQALREPGFWWLCGALTLAAMTTMAMAVHLIPILLDNGYSAGLAATLAGAVGLLAVPGRLTFIPLGGFVVWRYVLAAIFTAQAVALLLLIGSTGMPAVILYVVLFGAGAGALTPARAAIVAEYYGRRHYGSVGGAVATAITGARAAAPITTGLLYTVTGSYLPVLWTLAAAAAFAAVLALKARPPFGS
jgi:MFS family permease